MPATKVDFKRELRDRYLPGREPSMIDVPEMGFLMVDGHGDPSTADSYMEAIEALYSVAYAVKFAVRHSGIDFTVMPLESLWWSADPTAFAADRSAWDWTAMIMQPELVTAEIVEEAHDEVAARKPLPALDLLRYERFEEGLAAQVMNLGLYNEEGPTIAALHAFVAEQGFVRAGKHHEIYLSDPRHTASERLRTVIRQPVRPATA